MTESRRAQRAIEVERDIYRTMEKVVPGAFASFRLRPDGVFSIPYASPSIVDLFGATPEELASDASIPRERTHPDDRPRVEAALATSARELTPFHCDYRLEHPTRGEIWLEVASGPVREADGAIVWHGLVLDITERKRVEHELRAQRDRLAVLEAEMRAERDRFAAVTETATGAIYTYRRGADGTRGFPYVSRRIVEIFGCTSEELQAHPERGIGRVHPDDVGAMTNSVDASGAALTLWHEEFRVLHPTKGEIWIEGHSQPTRQADGSVTWHGMFVDITDRRRGEAKLRASEAMLRAVVETVPDRIVLVGRDAKVRFANRPPPGVRSEDVLGTDLRDHVEPSSREALARTIERVFTTKTMQTLEAPMTRDGELQWFDTRIGPVLHDGEVVAATLASTDITARKQTEERVRASEARLRSVLDTAPDIILSLDREGKILFINHTLPHLSLGDVIGTDAMAYLSPASRELAWSRITRVFETGKLETYDAEVGPNPDGTYQWHHTRVGPVIEDGKVVAVTVSATDLSARKHAELALRASEERYRRLIELLPDAVFVTVGAKIIYCNPAFVRLMGAKDQASLIGIDPYAIVHPEDHAIVQERTAWMREHNAPVSALEQSVIGLDGTRRQVSVVATPIVDGGKRGFLIVLHDLSDRQRTEHLLGSVLESVSDAILTIDSAGRVRSCNPAVTRLFGYTPEEVLGQHVRMLMPEHSRTDDERYLRDYLEAKVVGRAREVDGCRKDGSRFPIELSVTGFRLDGSQHFTGVVRDITERKRLEEQFRQAHKMEAFGQLAGGVAHDFNNLLTVILGETECLVASLAENSAAPPKAELQASLADIHDAGQRAAGLTRQLLAFSRKTVLDPKVLDVNLVVRETEKMLRRLIGEDILLSTKLMPNLKHVLVDPGQLSQVLMNLAVNARDAMPRGGLLEIETANVVLDASEAAIIGVAPGAFVRLAMRDTGVGMPADVSSRVFQPFFTTKPVGKGTGLGLAVVHGIVTQSGGAIRVESEVARGATFEVFLPVAVSARPPTPAEHEGERVGHEMVLVVEDDDAVRRLAMRVLQSKGYRVLFAHDGAEALAILERERDEIALLITDVVMPNMDGAQLGEALRQRFPEVKVLYVSGYTDDMLVRRGLQSEDVAFLPKPYTPVSLLHAVRQVLAREHGPGRHGPQR